jgi:hypothetical protein
LTARGVTAIMVAEAEFDIVDLLEEDVANEVYGPAQQVRWALEYIVTAYDESKLRHRREELRDQIKQWMTDNCDVDDQGSYVWDFDEPVAGEDETIYGFRLAYRENTHINEDRAWALVKKYGLEEECVEVVEDLDIYKLYAFNSDGTISDDEFDALFDTSGSYSLVKLTEET